MKIARQDSENSWEGKTVRIARKGNKENSKERKISENSKEGETVRLARREKQRE